ncbi:MAG: hypothetical protein QW508_00745, partial [Conexivisphaerales archaeon]
KNALAYNGTLTNATFYETEPMIIAGKYFDPSSTVTLYFGTQEIGTTTTNSTGFFNTTVTVPTVSAGTYAVNASDPLAYIWFSGSTVPEVVVTPTSVTPGSTISINGYAFTKSSPLNVTWVFVNSSLEEKVQSIANLTTNSLGEFSTTFMIPLKTLGGTSVINASVNDANPTAYATFDIVPTLMLSQSTVAQGSMVTANAYGLNSGTNKTTATIVTSYSPYTVTISVTLGHTADKYTIAYDNMIIDSYFYIMPNNGQLKINFQATGYPMLHYVQLVNYTGGATSVPQLLTSKALNVTGTTNTEASTVSAINSLNKTVSSLPSQISASLSSFETSISNEISGFSSTLSTISSGVSSIQSTLSSMGSTLSTISSGVSSIQSTLSGVSSSVSTISSISSSVSSLMTYIIVVAVLAVIIIIIQIIMLVRKK